MRTEAVWSLISSKIISWNSLSYIVFYSVASNALWLLTVYKLNYYTAVIIGILQWCHCCWLSTVSYFSSSLTVMLYDTAFVAFCRYQYSTKKKNYFRSWWTRMFHSWELRGLLRWPMLITLHCLKRRRQRNARHPILFSVSVT